MYRRIRCRIYPTHIQRRKFRHIFTLCRYAYNRMLDIWKEEYNKDKEYHDLISIKELRNRYPILKKVNSSILNYERNCLRHSIKRFFKGVGKYPRYHSYKNDKDSFGYYNIGNYKFNPNIKVLDNSHIRIPMFGIFTYFTKYNLLPYKDSLTSITISHNKHNQYFITILINDNTTIPNNKVNITSNSKGIGFDYDNPKTFVDSNNNNPNIRLYRDNEKYISKLNKLMSKYKYGSNGYNKWKYKLSQLHLHIADKRRDILYNLAKQYVLKYDYLVFENINLQHLADKSKEVFINESDIPIKIRLGKGIHDNGFGLFKDRVKQLCEEYGKHYIEVDMNYTSSQICSKCGYKKIGEERIKLNDTKYKCNKCGLEIDRDYNAAINIRNKGLEMLLGKE